MTTDTQPLAPTDAELIAELEAAGVEFMAFRGGLCGTKEVWVTAGSQDAKKIAQGVRAVLAKWGVQPVEREPLTLVQVVDEFCKQPHTVQFVEVFIEGVRFAEKYHGIKGGQHGAE